MCCLAYLVVLRGQAGWRLAVPGRAACRALTYDAGAWPATGSLGVARVATGRSRFIAMGANLLDVCWPIFL